MILGVIYLKLLELVEKLVLPFFFFFLIYITLFIYFYFWPCWVFGAVLWLSLVPASGGYSLLRCVGFSLRWLLFCGAQALGARASVVVACRLSSCGTWAQ